MTPIYLWAKRYTVSRGWVWMRERWVMQGYEEDWIAVFQKDEPDVEFRVSPTKPKD